MHANLVSIFCGWVALLFSLILALSAPSYAQHHTMGALRSVSAFPSKSLAELVSATPEQRLAIEDIYQQALLELRPQQAMHRSLVLQNGQLLAAPLLDETLIEQNQLAVLMQQAIISKNISKANIAMAQVLTPEQRSLIAPYIEKRLKQFNRKIRQWDTVAPDSTFSKETTLDDWITPVLICCDQPQQPAQRSD